MGHVTSLSPSAQNQPGLIAKTFMLSPSNNNNRLQQNKRMIVKKKHNSVKTVPINISTYNSKDDRQPTKANSVEAKKPTMLIL